MGSYYRTEALRTTHYLPNGEGRDTYIYVNNGGVEKHKYPYRFNEEGRTTKNFKTLSIPNLDAKALKYRTNGTGRDTYIGFNHGGLVPHSKQFSFYSSLRSVTPPTAKLYKVQNYGQYIKSINEARNQKQACMRLSVPKHLA